MTNPRSRFRAILSAAGLVFLAGCASTTPAPRYFVLEAPATSTAAMMIENSPMVLVGPITIADHLKPRGIASREAQGRVIISSSDRWAGALDQNIASVITEVLQQKRGPDNVIDYYSNFSADHDFAVKIHISKFDRVPGNQVALVASWQIRDGASTSKTVHSGTFSQPIMVSQIGLDDTPLLGPKTGDTVSAMNAALAELANAVHQSLQK